MACVYLCNSDQFGHLCQVGLRAASGIRLAIPAPLKSRVKLRATLGSGECHKVFLRINGVRATVEPVSRLELFAREVTVQVFIDGCAQVILRITRAIDTKLRLHPIGASPWHVRMIPLSLHSLRLRTTVGLDKLVNFVIGRVGRRAR